MLFGNNAAKEVPNEGPTEERPPDQHEDLLQQHQQRHKNKKKMNEGKTRHKNQKLTRRQRRNDARGYVPEPGAEPRSVEKAEQPTPEEQLITI